MPNNYFHFKQFSIQQEHCAMKVCTDACLFGALLPRIPAAGSVLDIGTGTGLLSLMYAQKNARVIIDAVEIDTAAAQQARENFAASPWSNRLHIFNADILQYDVPKKYDLIISNPPFFEGDLRSADENKNNAKHETSLSLQQLLKLAGRQLSDTGSFAVFLPFRRVVYFEKEAEETGLHLTQKILVKQTPKHDHFRGILFFAKEETELFSSEIIIKESDGNYSHEFTDLLKDYYLNL